MSLMRAFAKVAIAMAIAKGTEKFTAARKASRDATGRDEVAGAMSGKGGISDLLERISQTSRQPGGLDDAIDRAGAGGGLNSVLENISKGVAGKDGVAGILGGLAGAAASSVGKGGFADLLKDAINRQDEPKISPTKDQEATAALMLRAMIHAAKADGTVDDAERKILMDNLEDATSEEKSFVSAELAGPANAVEIARETPSGLEPQIYAVSIMVSRPDNPAEASYLRDLANALRLDQSEVARIHSELGVRDPKS